MLWLVPAASVLLVRSPESVSRIPVEVCPISNLRTGIFPTYQAHPIKNLFEAASLRDLARRINVGQKGFTLIEMIVVVGIIAVLAAVIIPNIGKFIGSGEQGAKDAEQESVQTAMNAMMADRSVNLVTAEATTARND